MLSQSASVVRNLLRIADALKLAQFLLVFPYAAYDIFALVLDDDSPANNLIEDAVHFLYLQLHGLGIKRAYALVHRLRHAKQ